MLWAKQQGPEVFDRFLDHLYPPFWRRELDIEDLAVLEAVLRAGGMSMAASAISAAILGPASAPSSDHPARSRMWT